MSAAKPAIPPQTAVTASPRTGSSSFMANKAPTTAPKKEAAHARKGVSSHPKIRKNSRSQRMGSGPSRPYARKECSEQQTRQKRDGERTQREASSRNSRKDRHDSDQHPDC